MVSFFSAKHEDGNRMDAYFIDGKLEVTVGLEEYPDEQVNISLDKEEIMRLKEFLEEDCLK